MGTAILISTCDRYRALARWTAGRLDDLWEEHPPVFFAGLSGREEEGDLTRRSDERDWMGVARDAVVDLLGRGFSSVYLILEDHPPLGRCHADVLNRRLPEVLNELNAANIGLLGYGQHRPCVGECMGVEGMYLEQVPCGDRWRFSLHPALWDLRFLEHLLVVRMSEYEVGKRTPWAFERHRDEGPVFSGGAGGGSYRICGERFEGDEKLAGRRRAFAMRRFFLDVALWVVRQTRGWSRREQCAAEWMWAYAFYSGPYPLFWSGLMVQGRPSEHLRRYLGVFPDDALVAGLQKI